MGQYLLNIDKEIEKLLKIKETLHEIALLKAVYLNLQVVSEERYTFLASKKLLKPDVYYYIAPLEIKSYIEDFQG
jgi:hypothetical protein